MINIDYREVTDADDPVMDAVAGMFEEMYVEMKAKGLLLQLASDGTEKWVNSLRKTLGRFTTLQVASEDGSPIAFAHGALGVTPDYLGNKKIGVVTHIYVVPEFRQQSVGRMLFRKLGDWFASRNVHSIELQVIHDNPAGALFWENLGFRRELLQYRKFIGD